MNHRIVEQAGVFTDLGAVRRLQSAAVERDEAIRAASRQFESFMTAMVLKSMRQANAVFEQGNPFHDNASQVYRDLLDQQMSLDFSSRAGSGLAERLARQLGAAAQGPETPLGEAEKTALDRVSRLRLRRPLLSSMIVGPQQERRPTTVAPTDAAAPAQASSAQGSSSSMNSRSADSRSVVGTAHSIGPERTFPEPASAVVQAAADATEAASDAAPDPLALLPQTRSAEEGGEFATPEAFIDTVYPAAIRVADELGVDPALLVAQAALETGWGRHQIRTAQGDSAFNLFGIKADPHWQGEVAKVTTTEYVAGRPVKEVATFRAYASYEESFRDYLNFVRSQPRYARAVALAEQPDGYMRALQEAGYATDPAYASKVGRIFNSDAMQRARVEWLARDAGTAEDRP